MKQLKTNPIYRTYFVNNNVIYAINGSTSESTDAHAKIYKKGDEDKLPFLEYEKKHDSEEEPEKVKYYLDSLITDGDKLMENGSFKKLCHECDGEIEITPFEYFKFLCEKQIATSIVSINRSYDYFYSEGGDSGETVNRLIQLGAPLYMFKQNYSSIIEGDNFNVFDGNSSEKITENDVIDFTQEKYDELFNAEILKKAKDAANGAINKYGKEVDTLTIKDS